MSFQKILPVSMALLSLTGCGVFFGPDGYFRDRGDDYLQAETIEPITLPRGFKTQSVGQLFVIPEAGNTSASLPAEFEVPRPGNAGVVQGEQRNEVKIQKLGERRWIAVNSRPDAVWPRVRGFLSERGLGLAVQDPTAGVLETEWLSVKDETAVGRDRYQLQLQQGLRPNSTEIHVRQMTLAGDLPPGRRVEWPSQSVNPDRENWMIKELSAYLAKDDTTQASMLAQSIGSGDSRVELVAAADPYLLLHVDYARGWASVGSALNNNSAGFRIDSSNREQGQWQVTYSATVMQEQEDTADSDSLLNRFGRVFGIGDAKDDAADAVNYRVQLKDGGDSVRVEVFAGDGKKLSRPETEKILRLIRANLS